MNNIILEYYYKKWNIINNLKIKKKLFFEFIFLFVCLFVCLFVFFFFFFFFWGDWGGGPECWVFVFVVVIG